MTESNEGEGVAEGSIHGRFQPFHNEHLKYALAALNRCRHLWIGLTQYDTALDELNPLGRHREKPDANPLKFYERIVMIREALIEADVDPLRLTFVPFPIETPSHLSNFLPTSVLCFTTICEEWNREKIAVLKKQGYSVDVLWEQEKTITASDVRRLLVEGNDDWRKLVPAAVARRIVEWNIDERLRRILESN